MFTGLIEKIGRLTKLEKATDRTIMTIGHDDAWDMPLSVGESIAVQGVCVTVTRRVTDEFVCDLLDETLTRTNLATKQYGARLNLERALRPDDRVGGHFVLGHVDGIGQVVTIKKIGRDRLLKIGCSNGLADGMVLKGAIACDGVSLTVTSISATSFEVRIIPFTWENTTLSDLQAGDAVNLETDILGKYVRRYAGAGMARADSTLDIAALKDAGFI